MTLSETFRMNLARLLVSHDMSQGELGRRLGHTRQYANQLVNAERDITLQTLQEVADAFNAPAWSLLREDQAEEIDVPGLPAMADIMSRASPAERKMALRVCEGIIGQAGSED